MPGLASLQQATAELKRRRIARPLDYIRWTPPQLAFLKDAHSPKLLRTGQQLGKTWVGLAEMIFRALGAHPFLEVAPPPIEAWIITVSWSQSVTIMRKFHDLCPRAEIHPDTEFDPVRGYRGRHPSVRFNNGSIVRFKTAQQGGLNLASASLSACHIDEPCSERVYAEILARLRRAGQHAMLGITLTPINGPPVDWLQTLCEAGKVSDHWHKMTPENLTPVGGAPLRLADGTVCNAAWIEKIRAQTIPREAIVTLDGGWEIRSAGRALEAYDETRHVSTIYPVGECKLSIGIDHGDGANFSQCAVLIAVLEPDERSKYPRMYVLDEYVSPNTTTPDQDARGILLMLAHNGLTWGQIDHVYGDRAYSGRRNTRSRKSNTDLETAITIELGIRSDSLRPHIRTVKRGADRGKGSVDRGVRALHWAMVRIGHFHIHPQCKRLRQSIDRWEYRDDINKHLIDCLRYAYTPWIYRRTYTTRTVRFQP